MIRMICLKLEISFNCRNKGAEANNCIYIGTKKINNLPKRKKSRQRHTTPQDHRKKQGGTKKGEQKVLKPETKRCRGGRHRQQTPAREVRKSAGGTRLRAGQKRKRKGCGWMRCGRGGGRAGVGSEGGLKHCKRRVGGGRGLRGWRGRHQNATRGGGRSRPSAAGEGATVSKRRRGRFEEVRAGRG
jgi:hypothetical protein